MSHEHFRKTLLATALMSIGGALVSAASNQAAAMSENGATNAAAPARHSQPAAEPGALSSRDRKFIEDAAQGGIAQVELGKLAARKATAPEVRQFGQRMVDDHSRIDGELKQLASGKGVALPIQMHATSKREYDQLEKLSGGAFDRQYMKAMVSDHENDIKAFRREETSARDADVRGFARKTLPALEEHLKLAKTDQVAVESETRSRGKS